MSPREFPPVNLSNCRESIISRLSAIRDDILKEIEEFLTGVQHADGHDRVLATVMNVRMANRGSGEDEKTKGYIRRQLELFKGNEVSYHNGDVLAAFDGPARAIRCAASITESAGQLGTEVKIGLHTGECDFRRWQI